MLELADRLLRAADAGRPLVAVTVVDVRGSAPRTAGTSMALAGDELVGSISGGCVEGAAVDALHRVRERGRAETARFGFDDATAIAAGLACGGELDVVAAEVRAPSVLAELGAAAAGRTAGIATIVDGPEELLGRTIAAAEGRGRGGEPTDADLRTAGLEGVPLARIRAAVEAEVAAGRTGRIVLDCGGARTTIGLFVESSLPAARLILFGAVEFASALAAAARPLGYRTTVVDPRPGFATPARMPDAHDTVVAVPHEYLAAAAVNDRTVVCVLTHDDDLDLPLLVSALEGPAAFVGAIGSRSTHERRMRALRAVGVAEEALSRLHSPIGLDIGASSPAETAVSILADVLAARSGGSGRPLRDTAGPIHRRAAAMAGAR